MNRSEQLYRRSITSIGIAMLLFVGFINVLGVLVSLLQIVLGFMQSDTAAYVIYQTVYAIGYLAAFMIPAILLKRMLKKRVGECLPMKTEANVTPQLFLIIPATIAIVYVFAYINSFMLLPFHYDEFTSEVLMGSSEGAPEAYEILLEFIVICMVPGFCEEFLFRGTILTNLLPYGRFNAILISSLLFALMHQNAGQILYTFVAGLFLGLVYERTGSIWTCTILHIINNFASLAQTTLFSGIRDTLVANTAAVMLEVLIFVVGILCLGILIPTFFFPKQELKEGVFGRTPPMSDTYAERPVSSKRMIRLFWSPPMVIFIVLVALQILMLLGMAVFYV